MVRHVRRKHGKPRLRAIRRVETPAGVQAQHDWFEDRIPIGAKRPKLALLLGALSYSRAKFCWPSEDQTQLSWHTGHHVLFGRYGGVVLWVRIDNLKTGVSGGAGPTAVLNRSYDAYARMCGFGVDACRAGKGSDKGKVERAVRTLRESFGRFCDGARGASRSWTGCWRCGRALAGSAAVSGDGGHGAGGPGGGAPGIAAVAVERGTV